MSRITTTFASDDQPIQRSLARMQRDMDKLVEKNRAVVEASKAGGTAAQKAAHEQTKGLADVQRELLKVAGHTKAQDDKQKKLNQSIKGGEQASRGFGSSLKAALSTGASGLTNMIGGFVTLQGVLRLVNAELANIEERQRKAKEVQLTEAGAQAKMLRNLSPADMDAGVAHVERIARETGVEKKIVYEVASEAVAAKGSMSIEDAFAAAEGALRVAPDSQQEATALGAGILDAASLTGVKDPMQNLGFVLAVGEEARAASLSSIAQNMVPAMAGIRTQGDTARQAAALGVSMENAMVDPEGRTSSTAALQLATQLGEFLPQEDTFKQIRGKRVVDKQGTGLQNTAERIAYLQANPLKAEEFLQGATFETKAAPFIKTLLGDRTSDLGKNYEDLQRRLPQPEQSAPLAEQKIAAMQAQPVQQTARLERTVKSGAASLSGADTRGAEIEISSKGLDDILQRVGDDVVSRAHTRAEYFVQTNILGQDPRKVLIDKLERMAKLLEDKSALVIGFGGEQEKASKAETLRELVASLKATQPKPEIPASPAVPKQPRPAMPPQAIAPPTPPAPTPAERRQEEGERPGERQNPLRTEDPKNRDLREINQTLRDTNQVEDLQEKRLREIVDELRDQKQDAPAPKPPAASAAPAQPAASKNPAPLGAPKQQRPPQAELPPVPPFWDEQGPVRPEPTVPHFDAENGILFEPPRPADADPKQWEEMAAAARGKFREAVGVEAPQPRPDIEAPPMPLAAQPRKARLPDVPELPDTQQPGLRLPSLKGAVADPNWLQQPIAPAPQGLRAGPQPKLVLPPKPAMMVEPRPTEAGRRQPTAEHKQPALARGLQLQPAKQESEKDARARRAAERKENGGTTDKEWYDMLDRNNAARAKQEGLPAPPPVPRRAAQTPDVMPTPRNVEPLGRDLDLSQAPPRRNVEPIEVKMPPLERAPSLAEQFGSLAEQLSAAGSQGGRGEALLPVLQTIANGFKDLLEVNRATSRGIEQLAGGGSRPRANASAMARGFNAHSEA